MLHSSILERKVGKSLTLDILPKAQACTKTRNAKTKLSKQNDRNHRNNQTKIAKPSKRVTKQLKNE